MRLISNQKGIGYFASYIKRRIELNKNFLCCITGQTGSGKTYSALRLAEQLDLDFNIENICFTAKDFMNLVNEKTKKLRKGSCIVFDEIQIEMSHLNFQNIQAKMINYILQTFRHKGFIMFVTTPHFNLINASARKLFHCRMETIFINPTKKQVVLKPFLLNVNQDTGELYKKYLKVGRPGVGISPLKRLKVGMASDELLKTYEAKKTQFTTDLNNSILRDIKFMEMMKEKKMRKYEQEIELQELIEESRKQEDIPLPPAKSYSELFKGFIEDDVDFWDKKEAEEQETKKDE